MGVNIVNAGSLIGGQRAMVVNADGSINTTASVSLGSVSIAAGSTSIIFGKSGADYYPLLSTSGTDGGLLRVDSSVSVSTGSEVYVKGGSILTYNSIGVGSVTIVNARYDLGSFLLVAGSISSMPAVSVSTGSEVYVKAGSIQTYSPVGIGSIWFGGGIGSVTITNSLTGIGSYAVQTISGVITVDNRVAGSIVNLPIGSNFTLSSPGSIAVYSASALAVSGIVNQGTSPWIVAGSFAVTNQFLGSNSWIPAGSVIVTNDTDMSLKYKQRLDYLSGNFPIYIGLALPGISTGSASWQIRKFGWNGVGQNISIDWGSGNTSFDKVWDSRSGTGEQYI